MASKAVALLKFQCMCGEALVAPADDSGKWGNCPVCRAEILIGPHPTVDDELLPRKFRGLGSIALFNEPPLEAVGLLRFRCLCGEALQAPVDDSGRWGTCPACSAEVLIGLYPTVSAELLPRVFGTGGRIAIASESRYLDKNGSKAAEQEPPLETVALLRFPCACGEALQAATDQAGKWGLCPVCNAEVLIGRHETVAAELPPRVFASGSSIALASDPRAVEKKELPTEVNPIFTQLRREYEQALHIIDHDFRNLIHEGKDMKALFLADQAGTTLLQIRDCLSNIYMRFWTQFAVLESLDSMRLKQVGHRLLPISRCYSDPDSQESKNVAGYLNTYGYGRKHWYFSEALLSEIEYLLAVLSVLVEPDIATSSPFSSSDGAGDSSIDRYIASSVKMAVWRRDQGRCVQCGSNERLEYDHIIPVARGGSNTERNIQLLCEPCNRRKGDSIL